ncbi:hypothetical protein FB381_0092 [Nocardioides albertanoniae]|uniref:Peptidase M1 membrane alanine aminopeptidase domain-containing protein n=1 Tax=Nocardioides albertanoniae TaxID=1175486 RepID=A0A543A0W8_9ACTN|nr:hypothetical protein FB381_0092 [Nocardioides albertanoniae]
MLVLTGGGLVMAAAPVAAAPNDGVAESSRTRYVLDESAGVVKVKAEITVTNQQPSSGSTYYFLTGHSIPIPADAKRLEATSNGAELDATTERVKGTGIDVATVSFANLYYGKSRTITWTYELQGAPIRAKTNNIRIGKGYAVFPVLGVGDDHSVTVEVVLPSSMDFSSSAPGFKAKKSKGKKTTWKATGGFLEGGVSARDPKVYDEEKMAVGDTQVSLQSFPGDRDWLDFAEKEVTKGLPALEKLIGKSWPGGLDTIREDVSSEALGYAWFDENAKEIVVSEDLDAAILYHEMTHAWINPKTVSGRWLSEGLTEVVAQRATKVTGSTGQSYPKVKRGSEDAFALLSWDAAGRDVTAEVDAYGYPAAYTAVFKMVAGLSDKEFTAVVNAAYEGRTVYDRPGDDVLQGTTDWHTFLDLVQRYDTDASPEKALRTWVLTPKAEKELARRAEARKSYAAVDRADGDWVPPEGLRKAMASWRFDDAATVTGLIEDAGAGATELQAAAKKAGLPASAAAKEAYEGADIADEYASLATWLPQAAQVTEEVGEATSNVDGTQNPVTELGELVLLLDVGAGSARADLDAGHLEDASATAARVQDRAGWAFGTGLFVLMLLAGAAYAGFRVLRSPWGQQRVAEERQRMADRKTFRAQVEQTKRAGAPWDRAAPPGPPAPPPGPPPQPRPQDPRSVGGELFGVQRRPDRPRGVEQLRRDDLRVQLEKREELRRFLRDTPADEE